MEKKSVKKEISKTALITIITLLVVVIVSAVIVCVCFPYSGYTVTSELGMNNASLFFAERYADKGNIDGLVYCVELDDKLYEKNTKKYAKKLLAHTEKFFTYDNYNSYFAQLDEYYITNSQPALRIGLYSYYSYVVSCNFRARKTLDKCDEMIFRGSVTSIENIFQTGSEGDNALTFLEKAAIYNALGAVVGADFKKYFEANDYEFFYEVTRSVPSYAAMLETVTDDLETLYLMRSLLHLIEVMNNFLDTVRLEVSSLVIDQWRNFESDFYYKDKSLDRAYSELFIKYIKQ